MHLLIAVCFMCCLHISGSTGTSGQFNADLSSLEDRFFLHEYSNETADQRLDRLDQFVFGRARKGSAEQRMTSLLLAVPNVQAESVPPSSTATQPGPAPLEPERPKMAANPAPQSNPNESIDYYPTVTALEEQIAHKTEISLPLQQRLARLETIAFGKPSTSKDLSKRVDLLKQYVSRRNGGSEGYLTSSNAVGWKAGDTGLVAEVSSMEEEVFGKTYGRDDLSSRLTRLEKNLLPQEPSQTFTPIAFRVNRLMAALNSPRPGTFSSAPAAAASWPAPNYYPGQNLAPSTSYTQQAQPAITTAQNANQPKHHSLLRKLGVALGDVGGLAERGMMYSGYGY